MITEKIHKNSGDAIIAVLTIIFSIVLALGQWNPFRPVVDESDSGFSFLQITSVIYVVSLLIYRQYHQNRLIYHNWKPYLVCFTFVTTSVTLVGCFHLSFSDVLSIIKLILAVLLCVLLPCVFINNKLLYVSLTVFSVTCGMTALLFSLGLLDQYYYISKGRLFIFGENANSTSARMAIAIILLLFLVVDNPLNYSRKRFFLLSFIIPLINMVFASGSRGAFIIFIACLVIFVFLYPTKSFISRCFLVLTTLVSAILIIVVVNQTKNEYVLFERLQITVETGNDGGREILVDQAMRIFEEHPLWGVGMTNFTNEMYLRFAETRTVHNMFVYILAVSGILGFVPFVLFMGSLMKKSIKYRKECLLPLLLILNNFLVAYKSGGVLTYLQMWYFFAVSISIINNNMMKKQSDKI